jgi:hypothetical protein
MLRTSISVRHRQHTAVKKLKTAPAQMRWLRKQTFVTLTSLSAVCCGGHTPRRTKPSQLEAVLVKRTTWECRHKCSSFDYSIGQWACPCVPNRNYLHSELQPTLQLCPSPSIISVVYPLFEHDLFLRNTTVTGLGRNASTSI